VCQYKRRRLYRNVPRGDVSDTIKKKQQSTQVIVVHEIHSYTVETVRLENKFFSVKILLHSISNFSNFISRNPRRWALSACVCVCGYTTRHKLKLLEEKTAQCEVNMKLV